MTAMIYADVGDAEFAWSRSAGVFEYLLEDLATGVSSELKQEIQEAIECQGWDVGALPGDVVLELKNRVAIVLSKYLELAPSAGKDEPDYLYLADASKELLEMLRRIAELRERTIEKSENST